MFLSAVLTHLDSNHSLPEDAINKSDVMLNISKYVLLNKQTHRGWPEGKEHFQQNGLKGYNLREHIIF